MRKRQLNLPVKIISFLAIILLAIYFVIGYIWKVLTSADFFAVKQVVVRNSDTQFLHLKGKNIFSLDLSEQARKAYLSCPDCRKVRFARVLPSCLVVDFLKRKPVAWVRFYKNFALDDQGVLYHPDTVLEELDLPLIYGLETKIFAPKPGRSYRRSEIGLALSIIHEFKANSAFNEFRLKRINLATLGGAGFFMLLAKPPADNSSVVRQAEGIGFEVRTGPNNIKQKMMILAGLVTQERKEWANIKYIDLRFKEPLIKLKNVK